jgi:hyperosmotically inducible protein
MNGLDASLRRGEKMNITWKHGIRRAALALALCVIGVGVISSFAMKGTPTATQQQPPARGSAHYSDWLTTEVHHLLALLPHYSIFDNLAYSVNGATVTLEGQVVHATIKDDAENAVKKIEGVEKVVNNIEILPPSPDDDQIRKAEYHAIYSFPSLQRYALGSYAAIHIIVKNGHVTLEGIVDSQADKDTANVRANGLANVFSVTNNLKVESGK